LPNLLKSLKDIKSVHTYQNYSMTVSNSG
jgi:hypothetical protein